MIAAAVENAVLFHIVETDDQVLADTPEAEWFRLLREFDWRPYRPIAARYYDALYQFNQEAATERAECGDRPANPETKDQARQRLLIDRPVMDDEAVVVYAAPSPRELAEIRPENLAPGVIPLRLVGRQPKDFFCLLKAFLGVTVMGCDPTAEEVHVQLTNNPPFARRCGFAPRDPRGEYRQDAIPSLRKLEQFDQIMTDAGLWNEIKKMERQQCIDQGVIKPESVAVHDTTHYEANSSFEVVRYEDDQGKQQKKSAPKPTKKCGCPDKEHCPHLWEYADEGAGTIVKSSGKKYWGHKASIISLAKQQVLLDALAVTDAACHDSRTLIPTLDHLFEGLPQSREWFDTVLDDGAADDRTLKENLRRDYCLRLVCSQNPRRRQPITTDLPRGVARILPTGEPICLADHPFDFRGVRTRTETFVFGPPVSPDGEVLCDSCPRRSDCCPRAMYGRHLTIPFDRIPFIDPEDPPLAKRFKTLLRMRTSVERVIKRVKCDVGTDNLTVRGTAAFQAKLDKTLMAYFILLRR